PEPGDLERLLAGQFLVVEHNRAGGRPEHAHDGVDQGRLAHAVAPEEDGAGSVADPQAHALQHIVDPPVGMEITHFDHGLPPGRAASGGPASGVPTPGRPASGGPASAVPTSGGPASAVPT